MEDEQNSDIEVVLKDSVGSDNDELLTKCLSLRHQVFIDEQNIDETLEYDGFDDNQSSVHILATIQRNYFSLTSSHRELASSSTDELYSIGTCRLRKAGPFMKLERVAVLKDWRRKGIGEQICNHAIRTSERNYDQLLLVTQAQATSIDFYEKLGFFAVSDDYLEAGIIHRTMIYWPKRSVKLELESWDDRQLVQDAFVEGECFDPNIISVIKERVRLYREQCCPRLLHIRFEINERVVGKSILKTYCECARATQRNEFERSETLEKYLLNIAWEKLNTGHYSQVNDAWRALYAAVSACKAYRLLTQNKPLDALRACDMGLIMGGDIDGRGLSAFATHIHSLCPPPAPLNINRFVFDEPKQLSNSHSIRRVHCPSLEEFCEFLMRQEPVVITGIVSEWPAFSKWSFEYLNSIIGNRTVPIEIGSSYADEGWSQSLMTVSDFMHEFVENKSGRGVGYLAQHRLFDQIPELVDDVIIPDYCAFGSDDSLDDVDLNIWLGPGATVSPLHTDPKSNIFCQVYGKKFLRVVPYAETQNVYPNEDGFLTNTSQVDVENPDLSKYPLFKSAHVLECTLSAGECLFIPTAYWHYVKSLEPSISVSCWFRVQSSSSG
ncbi:unnamed protein product [Anisakis simplex]|uniref:JmjC domain-containing protein 5 n=1 Tax=Anisakis simplex TaxID=6269 RepID=A0A0M3K0A1_ANISI|nr:unnamed protein product [Anisakis simplex]